jgi:hypothetical protein
LHALALSSDLQLSRVTVASNCLAVIKAMEGPFAGTYTMVIHEVKASPSILEQSFFRHENMSSNSEAHRLARSAVSAVSFSVGRQVWLLQPPDGLCIPYNIILLNKEWLVPCSSIMHMILLHDTISIVGSIME